MKASIVLFLIALFFCHSSYSQLQKDPNKVPSAANEKINDELIALVKNGKDINEIKKLIEAGADVNFRDAKKKTCRDYVSDRLYEKAIDMEKDLDIFNLLKSKGAETSSWLEAKKEYDDVSKFLPDKVEELIKKYCKVIEPPNGTDKKDIEIVYGKEHYINDSNLGGHYTPSAYGYMIDYPYQYYPFLMSNWLEVVYENGKVKSAGIEFQGKLHGRKMYLPKTDEEAKKMKEEAIAERLGDLRELMGIYFKNEVALKKAAWNKEIPNLKPHP